MHYEATQQHVQLRNILLQFALTGNFEAFRNSLHNNTRTIRLIPDFADVLIASLEKEKAIISENPDPVFLENIQAAQTIIFEVLKPKTRPTSLSKKPFQ